MLLLLKSRCWCCLWLVSDSLSLFWLGVHAEGGADMSDLCAHVTTCQQMLRLNCTQTTASIRSPFELRNCSFSFSFFYLQLTNSSVEWFENDTDERHAEYMTLRIT